DFSLAGGAELTSTEAMGEGNTLGELPISLSVPEGNSLYIASGRVTFRTMCGVISRTSSVFDLSWLSLENKRPNNGISPKPGSLLTDEVSLFWRSPASI